MPLNLDAYLGVHADALKLRGQRTELLARNLANADTPGYKAQDIDFRQRSRQRAARTSPVAMRATSAPSHRRCDALTRTRRPRELKYRTPLAPSLDGNTVDGQLEQAAFAENAVRYQATLSFLISQVPRR